LQDIKRIDSEAQEHFQAQGNVELIKTAETYQESLASGIMNALSLHAKKGDSMPIALLHSESREIKIGFQRDYGKG
jgi:hypothetical protein